MLLQGHSLLTRNVTEDCVIHVSSQDRYSEVRSSSREDFGELKRNEACFTCRRKKIVSVLLPTGGAFVADPKIEVRCGMSTGPTVPFLMKRQLRPTCTPCSKPRRNLKRYASSMTTFACVYDEAHRERPRTEKTTHGTAGDERKSTEVAGDEKRLRRHSPLQDDERDLLLAKIGGFDLIEWLIMGKVVLKKLSTRPCSVSRHRSNLLQALRLMARILRPRLRRMISIDLI